MKWPAREEGRLFIRRWRGVRQQWTGTLSFGMQPEPPGRAGRGWMDGEGNARQGVSASVSAKLAVLDDSILAARREQRYYP